MTTNTATNKITRVQVSFNATDGMNDRIQNLYQKYYGFSLSEIVKLAIIELDKSTQFEDETAYIKSDKRLYDRLLKNKNNPIVGGVSFSNIKELEDAFSQV
jgi:hypothetical protein